MDFKVENAGVTVPFSAIKEGDIFECRSEIYLKTEEIETEEWGVFNAVILSTGEMERFSYSEQVYKASANMTVKVFK